MRSATTYDGSGSVMDLLRSGVSLSLLIDLATPFGPPSDELYIAELVGT